MPLIQKLINLLIATAALLLLYSLHTRITQTALPLRTRLTLTDKIGRGEELGEEDLKWMEEEWRLGEGSKSSPLCFLKAYSEVVVKQGIDAGEIFNLFEGGKEFHGVRSCRHYYSLLIYRASASDHK